MILSIIAIVYLFSFAFGVLLGFIFLQKSKMDGAKFLGFYEFSTAIWALFTFFELISKTIEYKQFWFILIYVSCYATLMFFLAFSLEYSQFYKYLAKRYFIIIAIPVLFIVLAVSTNHFHHLWWTNVAIDSISGFAIFNNGILYYLHVAYAYTLFLASIIVLMMGTYNNKGRIRGLFFMIIGAGILAIMGNIIFVFNFSPIPYFDWTPLCFIFAGAIFMLGIKKYKFFDLSPIAQKLIFETMNDAIVVVDMKARIIMVNLAFKEIFKVGNKNIIGKPFYSILSIPFVSKPEFLSNKSYQTEIYFNNYYFDVFSSPLFNKRNIQIGQSVAFRNITRRKLSEISMDKTNIKLRSAIQRNELLISDLESFSHTVAHDLKSPLANQIGFIRMIKDEDLEHDKLLKYLDYIEQSAYKMQSIIMELLKLASIRKQKIPLNKVDVLHTVEAAMERLSYLINEKKAIINYPDFWPDTLGYAAWIEEIWLNYLSNAIKYGGTPPIIDIGYDLLENATIKYWVKNNGKSIPLNKQYALFEEFVQLNEIKTDGQGLGLSIVKRIVDNFGGKVGYETIKEPYDGSLFYFTLPVYTE